MNKKYLDSVANKLSKILKEQEIDINKWDKLTTELCVDAIFIADNETSTKKDIKYVVDKIKEE